MLICFLSAILWSSLDLLRKQLVQQMSSLQLAVVLAGGQGVLFAVWLSVTSGFGIYPGTQYLFPAILSVSFGAGGFYLYLNGISRAPVSVTVPLLSFTPVFASIAALFIGERLQLNQWLGLSLICCGGLMLRSSGKNGEPSLPQSLMLGAAACWGLNTVFDKLALGSFGQSANAAAAHGLFMTTVAAAIYGLALLRFEPTGLSGCAPARTLVKIGMTIIVAQAALASQLIAITLVPVGVFEGLKRSVGVGFAILLGKIIFDEPLTRKKSLAGALLMLGLGVLYGVY